jgi:uncharacterized protein YciI
MSEGQLYFVYRMNPPRPTFATDMDQHEAAIMAEHMAYWRERMDEGKVVVFGPVAGATGAWGLGVLVVRDDDEARALVEADPAMRSALATSELSPMPVAVAAI